MVSDLTIYGTGTFEYLGPNQEQNEEKNVLLHVFTDIRGDIC